MSGVGCQDCGRGLARSARFCGHCGARASANMSDARRTRPSRWRVGVVAGLGGIAVLAGAAALWPEPSEPRPDPGEVAVGTPSDRPSSGAPVVSEPPMDLIGSLMCVVDHTRLPGPECVRWTATDASAVFTHVEVSGTVAVAATADAVVGLDVGTGRQLWRWDGPSGSGPSDLLVSDSTVAVVYEADHRIVLLDLFAGGAFEAPSIPIREARQAWVALNKATLVVGEPASVALFQGAAGPGGPLWQRTTEPTWVQPAEPAPPPMAPLVTTERVVALTADGLSAWNRADGQPVWQQPGPVTTAPVVADNVIVVASEDTLAGLAPTDGTTLWEQPHTGVGELITLGDGRFAVLTAGTIDVRDGASGEPLATLEPGRIDDARLGRPGELLLTIGSTLQRWDIDLAGATWSLQGLPPRSATSRAATVRPAQWSQSLIVVLDGGTTLVGIDLPASPLYVRPTAVDCADGRPSAAMGDLTGWQGRHAHVAIPEINATELWVGLPGEPTDTRFTLQARLAGSTDTAARFATRTGQTPTEQVEVEGGGRRAGGFPTHWAVLSNFPEPGCWQVTITTDKFSDTVTLPLDGPPADR